MPFLLDFAAGLECESITGAGFGLLSSLTSLQDLSVHNTNINDEGFRAISSSLTRLTKLNLESCKSITASGFVSLSSLTSLEGLSVCNTNINDGGLRVIGSLRGFHTLDLLRCPNVSARAVASLSISNVFFDEVPSDDEE